VFISGDDSICVHRTINPRGINSKLSVEKFTVMYIFNQSEQIKIKILNLNNKYVLLYNIENCQNVHLCSLAIQVHSALQAVPDIFIYIIHVFTSVLVQ